MTVIDVHQHLWPPAFVAALRAREAPPRLTDGALLLEEGQFPVDPLDYDLDARLAALDRDGVDVAVISLQPTLGLELLPDAERHALEEIWSAGALELVAASGGRVRAMAPSRVLPGFAGTVVAAGLLADLDRAAPLLSEAERAGSLVFVHPGPVARRAGTPPWWAGIVDYTAQMQSAWYAWLDGGGSRWPELRIAFAILAGGAPFHLERLALRGIDVRSTLDENVYLDVATYGRRAIELCLETFGVEQLLYGSDTPVVDPAPTLRAVRAFGDSVARIVCSDNPGKLLT